MADLRAMPLARLSICKCGFSVLRDEIPIGAIYTVDIASKRSGFTYRCGRCGVVQYDVEVVDCAQRLQPGFAPIPFSLFSSEVTQ